jgi:hypothetical protein
MNIDYKKEKIEEFIRFVQEKLDDNSDNDIDYIYSNITNIKQNTDDDTDDNTDDDTIFNYIYVLSKVVIYAFYDNY